MRYHEAGNRPPAAHYVRSISTQRIKLQSHLVLDSRNGTLYQPLNLILKGAAYGTDLPIWSSAFELGYQGECQTKFSFSYDKNHYCPPSGSLIGVSVPSSF